MSELRGLLSHKLSREFVGLQGGKYDLVIWGHEFGEGTLRIIVELYRSVDSDTWSDCLVAKYLIADSQGRRETGTMN
jgi:hypothetical protein